MFRCGSMEMCWGFRSCSSGPEERWYRQGEAERGDRQFVVEDPDGYLLRFFSDLGERIRIPNELASIRQNAESP